LSKSKDLHTNEASDQQDDAQDSGDELSTTLSSFPDI